MELVGGRNKEVSAVFSVLMGCMQICSHHEGGVVYYMFFYLGSSDGRPWTPALLYDHHVAYSRLFGAGILKIGLLSLPLLSNRCTASIWWVVDKRFSLLCSSLCHWRLGEPMVIGAWAENCKRTSSLHLCWRREDCSPPSCCKVACKFLIFIFFDLFKSVVRYIIYFFRRCSWNLAFL